MEEIDPELEKIKLQLKIRLEKAKEMGVSPLSPIGSDLIEKYKKLGIPFRNWRAEKKNKK